MKNPLPNWKKNLLLIFVSLFFSILLVELFVFFLSEKGFFNMDKPAYSLGSVRNKFWADLDPHFGVWHLPYSQYHHRKSCLDARYTANSHGARDKERQKNSSAPRIIVLGDSFIEGWGVADGKRLSDLLEKDSGKEFLNFGTSGYFSTTQYYLLYKTFAKNFSHSGVLVAILPGNDFLENDLEMGKKAFPHRYRPYFVGKYPDYQLTYFDQNILKPGESGFFRKVGGGIRGFLRGFSYTYNAIIALLETRAAREALPDQKTYSGYYDFTEEQWLLMKFTLQALLEEAKGKEVTLVTLPVLADLKRYDREGSPPLPEKLRAFSEAQGIRYVDLLPAMHNGTEQWNRYFHTCDRHWNDFGNETAFKILKRELGEGGPPSVKPFQNAAGPGTSP